MTTPAAIAGSFSDFKLVRTRSTAQIIIEIPIEAADEALRVLGGVPQSGKENPVAVARLNLASIRSERTVEPATQAPARPADGGNGKGAERAKGGWRARQAGIVCNEGAFAKYLEKHRPHRLVHTVDGEIDARRTVHVICGVKSRADLDHNEEAGPIWDYLYSGYVVWRDDP